MQRWIDRDSGDMFPRTGRCSRDLEERPTPVFGAYRSRPFQLRRLYGKVLRCIGKHLAITADLRGLCGRSVHDRRLLVVDKIAIEELQRIAAGGTFEHS